MVINVRGRSARVGAWVVGLCWLVGCHGPERPAGYAGVVEYDERHLSFEVGGRMVQRPVERGSRVEAGQLLARLDDAVQAATRDVQQEHFRAAQAQANLVAAGPKRSELQSMAARIQAARAAEERLEQSLARQRELLSKRVTPQAVVDDLQRQLEQARAERSAAQAQYRSLASGARAEEIAAASARSAAARSAVDLQQRQLDQRALHAPLAGEVVEVHAEPGETLAPGMPVVTLADVVEPVIEVFVPQGQLAGIAIGRKAELRVDSVERPFAGEVEYVARKTEFTPRYIFNEEERPRLVVRVRVRVQDSKAELHAGVPGFVRFL